MAEGVKAEELEVREAQAREMKAREIQAREIQAREIQAREIQAEYVADLANVAVEPVPHNRDGELPANTVEEERQFEILNEALESGHHIALVAKRHGIHRNTLFRWLRSLEEENEVNARAIDQHMIKTFGEKVYELVGALTTSKLEKASARDIAIAAGILFDKRRDLLGPVHKDDAINLRIAWKDGSGAVELSTGRKGGGKRT